MNKEIQNLRAAALIFILLGHMPIPLPNALLHGYTFVSVFLIISGYFAAVGFMRRWDRQSIREIVPKELRSRLYRLLPLMWFWILVAFLVGNLVIYYGGQYGDMYRWAHELFAAVTFTYNYYLAGQPIGGLFGQYWTLFVEIHFFVLFIILFSLIRERKKRIILSCVMILLTVFVFRPLTPVMMIRYCTHTQLDSLFLGVLIALIAGDRKYLNRIRIPQGIKFLITLLLCIALFLAGYFCDTYAVDPSIKYVFYTALGGMIFFLARENDGWFRFPVPVVDRLLNRMGNISASVYVSHVLIYSCLYFNLYYNTGIIPNWIKSTTIGTVIQVIGLIIIACLVGQLSLMFIEKPYSLYAKKGSVKDEKTKRIESV